MTRSTDQLMSVFSKLSAPVSQIFHDSSLLHAYSAFIYICMAVPASFFLHSASLINMHITHALIKPAEVNFGNS